VPFSGEIPNNCKDLTLHFTSTDSTLDVTFPAFSDGEFAKTGAWRTVKPE
jgi:hypothetical protein